MAHLLHIGMPKCFSAPLQDMFARDEGNFYLGMEPSHNVPKQVLYAIETELLQVPTHHYNELVVGNLFQLAFDTAKEESSGTVVLSEDRLFDGYTLGGASVSERLERLARVMPEDTVVLMVARNPVDYMKQYYRYLVMQQGLTQSFGDWVRYLIVRGSKSFLGLLDTGPLVKLARKHFKTVEVLLYEQLLATPDMLTERMAGHGITLNDPVDPIDRYDYGEAQVAHYLELAKQHAGALASSVAMQVDRGDIVTYSENSPTFDGLLLQDATKETSREALHQAAQKLAANDATLRLDYTLDRSTHQMVDGYVQQVNRALAEETGIDLEAYGYDLGSAD